MNRKNHISLDEQIAAVSRSIDILKSTVGIFEEDRDEQNSVVIELNKMMAVRESLKRMGRCESVPRPFKRRSEMPVQIMGLKEREPEAESSCSLELDRFAHINDTMAALGILLYGSHVAIAESSPALSADNMRRISQDTIKDAQDLLNSLETDSLLPETECVGYAGTI